MIKSVLARNAACNAIVDLVDTGSLYPSGRLQIFNDSSEMLTWLEFSNPAFQDATDGTAFANYIGDSTAFQDGTMSWFSVVNRDATVIWTGTISKLNGTGDMKFPVIFFPADTTVSISSAYYVVPA